MRWIPAPDKTTTQSLSRKSLFVLVCLSLLPIIALPTSILPANASLTNNQFLLVLRGLLLGGLLSLSNPNILVLAVAGVPQCVGACLCVLHANAFLCGKQCPRLRAPEEYTRDCSIEKPQALVQRSVPLTQQRPQLVKFSPCSVDSVLKFN